MPRLRTIRYEMDIGKGTNKTVGLVKNYESLLALRYATSTLPITELMIDSAWVFSKLVFSPDWTFSSLVGTGVWVSVHPWRTRHNKDMKLIWQEEINKRVAVFFGGAVLAGAFGGIFGYALSRMAGVGGLNGWQWIFIMEGMLPKSDLLATD